MEKYLPLFLRRILGFSPMKGDIVFGSSDWSVTFEGVIIDDTNRHSDFPHYLIVGTQTISTNWNGDLTEKVTNHIISTPKAKYKYFWYNKLKST